MSTPVNYDDKQMLTDVLTREKHMTSNYNTYLCESATPTVRQTLSGLLIEEHDITNELWQEMNSRGYYPVPSADTQKVEAAKNQFAPNYQS